MKKIFIISLIFLFISLFFLGVYNFAFKKNISTDIKNNTKEVVEEKKEPVPEVIIKKGINKISKTAVLGAVFDKKTEKIFYYSAKDGTAWQINPDGSNPNQISSTVLSGLRDVKWSQDKSKVITHFFKEEKESFFEYDYTKKIGTQLSEGIDAISWDNLGLKIVYKFYDAKTKKRTLNISNPDGSNWQIIADMPFRDVAISQIPLTSLISFWNTQNSIEESKLQTVGVVGGEVKTIFQGRYGANYLWSPDGTKSLVSSAASSDGKNISLGLIDLSGKYTELSAATLASKCAWSADSRNLYCAVPKNIASEVVMPDDYVNNKINTQDYFWKIDSVSGSKQQLVKDNSENYDASSLFLSSTEDSLFFVNKPDGKLYQVEL